VYFFVLSVVFLVIQSYLKIIFINLKLLFYSVISNYQTLWILGLIKKTGTVAGKGLSMDWEKQSNILVVGSLLFGQDFEFSLYVGLGLLYPGLDIIFGLGK